MRLSLILILPLAAALVTPRLSAQAGASADTARLTFAWPIGTSADVTASRHRQRMSETSSDTSETRLAYRLHVVPHDGGQRITYSDFRLLGAEVANPAVSAAMAQLAELMPSFVVSDSGEFMGPANLSVLRATMDSVLAPIRAEMQGKQPELEQLLASLTSDEMLSMRAAEEWNALVGTWIDAELEVGSEYELEAMETVPLFGGMEVPMTYTLGAVRRLPCDSADSGNGCVELQMVSRPDPAAMTKVLARVFAGIMPDGEVVARNAQMNIENTVILIARPETLLPYRVTVTKEVKFALQTEGKREEAHQLDVRKQEFRYLVR